MNGKDFFDQVNAHPDLEGADICNESGEDVAYVVHKPSDTKYRLTFDAIATEDWDTLEAVLTGKREAHILDHMTRVVGYYSRIENWNKSKHGELKDRHKGQYGANAPDAL